MCYDIKQIESGNISMNIMCENNNLILTDIDYFTLKDTFECGQCFRWNVLPDGGYFGIAGNRALKITQSGNEIIFHETSMEDFESFWKNYFDFERDYGAVKETIAKDNIMKKAFEFGTGIRILRQQLWECVVSFIISASNNIPRIKKIVELFCENFGSEIFYMGNTYHAFPTPEQTAVLSVDDLKVIRAGFRDKYIIDAAEKFLSDSDMLEENLLAVSSFEAKEILLRINGVGNKVADCILLFGLGKYDSFPIDVWMKRIMEYCYFNNIPQDKKTIARFAKMQFGELSGFAQQYLFFYARENKIGVSEA